MHIYIQYHPHKSISLTHIIRLVACTA